MKRRRRHGMHEDSRETTTVRHAAIPQSVADLLDDFRTCFTKPGFTSFVTMVVGWIVCSGRHSICRVIQAADELGADKHHSSHYRFLSQGRWSSDAIAKALFCKLLRYSEGKVRVVIDDTLCRKSGPHIFGASMHYDARTSTYGRGTSAGRSCFFAFGHNWVVMSLWIPLPWSQDRGLAIPFLFRLYRSKKRCPKSKYRKRTVIAAEMVDLVASWLPADRTLHVLGDSEYACKTVVRSLPESAVFTGAMCMDAALHEPPPPYSGMGRPRVVGKRLPSPKEMAASTSRWTTREISIYGKTIRVKTKSVRCLWRTVAGPKLVQVVVTRDPSARIDDRAYFSTVDESVEQSEDDAVLAVLTEFAKRWEIEVAFRNTKQAMGLEDPQNGWWRRPTGSSRPKKRPGPNAKEKVGEQAIHHTLACAFVSYAITIVWYLENGNAELDVARVRSEAPWYRHKSHPSFTDMLVGTRRELWASRLSRHPGLNLGREEVAAILPQWHLAA